MTLYLCFIMAAAGVAIYFLIARAQIVCHIRCSFIDDEALWPAAYKALPSFDDMVFNPRHQLRWTKAQWVKYVGVS